MSQIPRRRILIIGAGSMGMTVGYHLGLSGAKVTFLIRPHHAEALNRPQILYCYDDNTLKDYKRYDYITDPSGLIGANYDYILVTLDAASLRSEVGQSLVKTIGDAARSTETKIVLGSVFIELRSWFLETSSLAAEQVTNGFLAIHAYPADAITLPVHPPTDPHLIAKADLAYIDCLGQGLILDDSASVVAAGFAEIYNACGVSRCTITPASELALSANPMFAVFAACGLMDWPKFEDIGGKGEFWTLAVAAVKEIQRLGIHGEPGQQAAQATTEAGLAESLARWEKHMLPLDLQAFNRFHHGKKVIIQDRALLHACVSSGEDEDKPMPALKELLRRHENHQVDATQSRVRRSPP